MRKLPFAEEAALARRVVRWPDPVAGLEYELGLRAIPEDDDGLLMTLLGDDQAPEVFPSVADRDARLGSWGTYFEYRPTDFSEWIEWDLGRFAVGPNIDEHGFDEIASVIVEEALKSARLPAGTCGFAEIVISRVHYQIYPSNCGFQVVGGPLTPLVDGVTVQSTCSWLKAKVENLLSKKEAKPATPS